MTKGKNLLTRRDAIKLASGSSLSLAVAGKIDAATPERTNLIIQENRKPGATDWQLTRVRPDAGKHRTVLIEGYCSKQSIRAGEKLDIMVSTAPAVSYKLDIYRTGYYGGTGARLMQTIGPLQGKE